jgi:N-dimethylarginine dimethylaminohydrolase
MKISTIIMAKPDHFDIAYAINPHMRDEKGQLKKVDTNLAKEQWSKLRLILEKIGFKVETLESKPELYDFVFCANTFFSWKSNNKYFALLSRMMAPARQPEVEIARKWLHDRQVHLLETPESLRFEAMGDLIWNLEKNEIYAGHGFRTTESALDFLRKTIPFPLIPLKLVSEYFYHLDTCFFVLNSDCAAVVKEALEPASLKILENRFKNLITIDHDEALNHFAGNAFCPDGRNVIIQSGAKKLAAKLESFGFLIHSVNTSEFIKSGGSVFCLKNFLVE